jgi:YgiT-type zinc finger domain-containing protein
MSTTSPNNPIRCAVCGGTQVPTTITHHARRGATIYVFENVPAFVCDQCGEVWLDGEVLDQIDRLIASGKVAPAPVSDYGRLVPA